MLPSRLIAATALTAAMLGGYAAGAALTPRPPPTSPTTATTIELNDLAVVSEEPLQVGDPYVSGDEGSDLAVVSEEPLQVGDPYVSGDEGSDPAAVNVAKLQLGDAFAWGDEGPDSFDCSGFVYYSFRTAGLVDLVGGSRLTVREYWHWFAERGWASRSDGRRGDLVIWGDGKHMGIYLGEGRAISALWSGVKIHGLYDLRLSFTTFLHVQY